MVNAVQCSAVQCSATDRLLDLNQHQGADPSLLAATRKALENIKGGEPVINDPCHLLVPLLWVVGPCQIPSVHYGIACQQQQRGGW